MDFVLRAVVFDAKKDALRVAGLAEAVVVVGQGRGHGVNGSLAGSSVCTMRSCEQGCAQRRRVAREVDDVHAPRSWIICETLGAHGST
eukprot:6668093-Pyramimonas_sp.AAC.1